jgi:hypothetical protein
MNRDAVIGEVAIFRGPGERFQFIIFLSMQLD